eukprot:7376592-Prymnesium_polylepis.1
MRRPAVAAFSFAQRSASQSTLARVRTITTTVPHTPTCACPSCDDGKVHSIRCTCAACGNASSHSVHQK